MKSILSTLYKYIVNHRVIKQVIKILFCKL